MTYSLSKEKSAVSFYIMQCPGSFDEHTQVPLKFLVDRSVMLCFPVDNLYVLAMNDLLVEILCLKEDGLPLCQMFCVSLHRLELIGFWQLTDLHICQFTGPVSRKVW